MRKEGREMSEDTTAKFESLAKELSIVVKPSRMSPAMLRAKKAVSAEGMRLM